MNKFIAIACLASLLISINADDTMTFNASSIKTFAFVGSTANNTTTFSDALYYGTEAKVSDWCSYFYGFQITFPVNFNSTDTPSDYDSMEFCFKILSPEANVTKQSVIMTNSTTYNQTWPEVQGDKITPEFNVTTILNDTVACSLVTNFSNANMDQTSADAGKWCLSFDNTTDFFRSVSNNTDLTVNFLLDTKNAGITECKMNDYEQVVFCNVGDKAPEKCKDFPPALTFSRTSTSSTSVWLWVGVGVAGLVVVVLVIVLVSKGCKEGDVDTQGYNQQDDDA